MTAEPDDRPRARPATEEEARALASAIRLRIIQLTLDQPLTNKEIAERLGRNPASVLHHVRRLVQTGFLAPEPVRRGRRGAREVPYRSTGKSWALAVSDTDRPAGQKAVLGAFLGEMGQAGPCDTTSIRLGLRLTEDELGEFVTRVHEVFDEYARRPRSEHGRSYGVFFTVYPVRRPPDNGLARQHRPCDHRRQ